MTNYHNVRVRPSRAEIRNYNEVFLPRKAGQLPMFAGGRPEPPPAAASPEPAEKKPAAAVRIHADGACIGNPGPGGFAALIEEEGQNEPLIVTGGHPSTTNNRMELTAVIEALIALGREADGAAASNVTVRSDSQYVINAFNRNWLENWRQNGWQNAKGQPVANMDLWRKLLSATEGRQIAWEWVKGHSGDPDNEECDRLANRCAQGAHLSKDGWVNAVRAARGGRRRTPDAVQARELNSSIKQEVELALELLRNGEAQSSREAMETALRTIARQDEAIAILERKAG